MFNYVDSQFAKLEATDYLYIQVVDRTMRTRTNWLTITKETVDKIHELISQDKHQIEIEGKD